MKRLMVVGWGLILGGTLFANPNVIVNPPVDEPEEFELSLGDDPSCAPQTAAQGITVTSPAPPGGAVTITGMPPNFNLGSVMLPTTTNSPGAFSFPVTLPGQLAPLPGIIRPPAHQSASTPFKFDPAAPLVYWDKPLAKEGDNLVTWHSGGYRYVLRIVGDSISSLGSIMVLKSGIAVHDLGLEAFFLDELAAKCVEDAEFRAMLAGHGIFFNPNFLIVNSQD